MLATSSHPATGTRASSRKRVATSRIQASGLPVNTADVPPIQDGLPNAGNPDEGTVPPPPPRTTKRISKRKRRGSDEIVETPNPQVPTLTVDPTNPPLVDNITANGDPPQDPPPPRDPIIVTTNNLQQPHEENGHTLNGIPPFVPQADLLRQGNPALVPPVNGQVGSGNTPPLLDTALTPTYIEALERLIANGQSSAPRASTQSPPTTMFGNSGHIPTIIPSGQGLTFTNNQPETPTQILSGALPPIQFLYTPPDLAWLDRKEKFSSNRSFYVSKAIRSLPPRVSHQAALCMHLDPPLGHLLEMSVALAQNAHYTFFANTTLSKFTPAQFGQFIAFEYGSSSFHLKWWLKSSNGIQSRNELFEVLETDFTARRLLFGEEYSILMSWSSMYRNFIVLNDTPLEVAVEVAHSFLRSLKIYELPSYTLAEHLQYHVPTIISDSTELGKLVFFRTNEFMRAELHRLSELSAKSNAHPPHPRPLAGPPRNPQAALPSAGPQPQPVLTKSVRLAPLKWTCMHFLNTGKCDAFIAARHSNVNRCYFLNKRTNVVTHYLHAGRFALLDAKTQDEIRAYFNKEVKPHVRP